MKLIVSLMVASILGLLGFQGYSTYLSIQENQKIFDRSVRGALRAASSKLEKTVAGDRSINFIIKMDSLETVDRQVMSYSTEEGESSVVISHNSSDIMVINSGDEDVKTEVFVDIGDGGKEVQTFSYSTSTSIEVEGDSDEEIIIKKKFKEIKDKEKVFSGVWEELILEETDYSEIEEELVDSLLKVELRESGVDLDFDYSVIIEESDSILFGQEIDPEMDAFEARLMPSLFFESSPLLKVYFPGKARFLFLKSGVSLLTTVVLLLFMSVSFWVVLSRFNSQKKLNALKDDIISNVSHELNTPIANISLAVESMKEGELQKDKSKLERYLGIIASENHRLQRQVGKLLSFSGGKESDVQEEILLTSFFKAFISRNELLLQDKNASIKFNLDEKLENKFPYDLLEVVFSNLLDNAIKYGGDQLTISIDIKDIGGEIGIVFQDSGPGIPQEYREKIFDRFFRVPTGNIHDVQGSGLGLSIVKEQLIKYGGGISFLRDGEGAAFEIKLPKSDA